MSARFHDHERAAKILRPIHLLNTPSALLVNVRAQRHYGGSLHAFAQLPAPIAPRRNIFRIVEMLQPVELLELKLERLGEGQSVKFGVADEQTQSVVRRTG